MNTLSYFQASNRPRRNKIYGWVLVFFKQGKLCGFSPAKPAEMQYF